MTGKLPIRMREVSYVLSPNHQKVMAGAFQDMRRKWDKHLKGWVYHAAVWCGVPLGSVMYYASYYKEREKMESRY